MRCLARLATCALLAGCGEDGILQPRAPEMLMTLTVTPAAADPEHPLEIAAEVVNATAEDWSRTEGCGVWGQGMTLEIRDPNSQLIHLWNPLTQPACADYQVAFAAHEQLLAVALFDGTIFLGGNAQVATTGLYTVVARFITIREGETRELVRHAVFRWSAD